MYILVLVGVYLVFKVTISYEKLHQDNARSTERYVILWDVVKHYKILEIVVISTQRDNLSRFKKDLQTSETQCFWGFLSIKYKSLFTFVCYII